MEYRAKLDGALAEVRFTLTHYLIGKKDDLSNVYTAELQEIVVIFPGKAGLVSPKKRKIFAVHPSSPSKKKKTLP
jgi:hypothetical protein